MKIPAQCSQHQFAPDTRVEHWITLVALTYTDSERDWASKCIECISAIVLNQMIVQPADWLACVNTQDFAQQVPIAIERLATYTWHLLSQDRAMCLMCWDTECFRPFQPENSAAASKFMLPVMPWHLVESFAVQAWPCYHLQLSELERGHCKPVIWF